MLTQKQEKFVQELIKGKSQREAYKASYNASKMKAATIDTKAYLLFKKEEIRKRYDELNQKAIAKTAKSAEDMRAFIIETYEKIASGEICEKTEEYDANGKLLRQRRSVKPSDVKNALDKLAEYYGVAPVVETQQNVVIKMESIQDYAD